MLVGNSLPEYIFIRFAVLGFRIVAPLSVLYTFYVLLALATPAIRPDDTYDLNHYRLPLPLEIYLFIEAGFFLLVHLPLRFWLQSAASHPEPATEGERRVLFQKILDTVSDIECYLSGWFLGASIEAIGRENVNEFVAWSMMNDHLEKLDAAEIGEVDEYVDDMERKLGRKFKAGRENVRSLRGTFDPVSMQHRPLIWYLIVGIVDSITYTRLWWNYFHFYRTSLLSSLSSFPPRPLAFFGHSQKPPGRLSYWYRKHTSKTKLPIVFIHGMGVGLYAYVDFIAQIISRQSGDVEDADGDIGIIVLELLPISSRICPPALTTHDMKAQIQQILKFHGWEDFVLIGHSYGTAIASTILRDASFSPRVKAAMLMDPICFLLHYPDVAYNFTRRKPHHANERMLHYFSSQDMLISHTLARHFFWSEYILWKEDINPDVFLTVTLSGKDLIVPSKEVWTYLTDSAVESTVSDGDSTLKGVTEWKNGKREVLWLESFDHAGLFNSKGARRGVAGVAKRLCGRTQ